MIEYIVPLSMVICLLVGIFSGYPVAFVLGGVGILFAFFGGLPLAFLKIGVSRIYAGVIENWLLLAVPLFVFMGAMLDKSGLAQNLLYSLERALGRKRGGLAISVALLGIVMAASTGIVGASVVMLSTLALPIMLRENYKPELAVGTIAASGTLGILIPPSIMLVLVGDILQISVGELFLGAIVPGLLLGGLYIAYIVFIALTKPSYTPISTAVRAEGSLFIALLRDLFAPLALILTVLGSIATGTATPTEAAGLGAICAMVLAAMNRKLTFRTMSACVRETGNTSAMILGVLVGATIFGMVFKGLKGDRMIENAILFFDLGAYGTLGILLLLIFIMGFFLEWVEISFIVLPLFAPIVAALDFGLGISQEQQLLWFAMLVAVNLQTSFLTPPFGYSLFYIKGVAPPEITIRTIYRGIVPFVALQLFGLALLIIWPDLVLWAPDAVFGN
ncbi:Sialic acid TRAP transporter permease protein SiaT [Roseovarius litorisediminis]|uniref:TRAP transporter large permease protein n=1 Tax=Roseovarius litorisediminis TaxID=1312363 RepID=A0A1Y5R7C3_9RHOB|nr:TRAP transporter large permease subunit [Roseovarius litorisediminis]SLN10830.1 Sialic acid TRAP transporter permease protein SiaT [Roseovarius litorisediminis]